jgi:small-conductance mechanosensitive channel/CRP-like cAMP-binding protein
MSIDPTDPLVPLLAATFLLFASVIIPRLRPRWPLWVRVLSRITIFVALTLLVQRILGSPLQPTFSTTHVGQQFWEQVIEASWWLVAARVVAGFARLFVVLENRPRETQIVSDLLAGAIYVATVLAIVNFAFSVPIRGLLATSGVIAIVLGLALQSTLSDVFSGIAVGLEGPYKAGDLIWVEGGIEGYVVQLNWRSTQIATVQNNIAIVPNSIIAKARLINRNSPTQIRGETISVSLDANAVPAYCLATLDAAVRACRLMIPDPGPTIACTGLRGDGLVYEIGFFVENSSNLTAARTEVFTQLYSHLRHAGIALAVAGIPMPPAVGVPTLAQLLEQSDLFSVIDPADRTILAEYFTPHWLQPGDTLLREGHMPESLFLAASGTADVTRSGSNGPQTIYRLGPGETLGAVGLITGAAYTATATALTPMKLYRLDKAGIAAAIKCRPDLTSGLEVLAHRGQAILRQSAVAFQDSHLDQPAMFLPRLRNFLHLLSS